MVLNSIMRGMWNHFALVLHFGVIITLVGVSIWDSTLIINSFVNDNRLTMVRSGVANNSSKFLENITIITYSPFLPKPWYEELELANFERSVIYQNAITAVQNGEVLLNSLNISTIDGKFMALAIQSQLGQMDATFISNCLIRERFCDDDKYLNLSGILRNATELENIQDGIVSEIYNYMVGGGWNYYLDDTSVTIHSVEDVGTTMELHVASLLMGEGSAGVLNLRLPEQVENKTGSDGNIGLFAGRSEMHARLEANVQHTITLQIKNLGIHDIRETTPCTNEPVITPNFQSHPACDDRGFLKLIVKKCGCVPYTERMNYRKFRDSQDTEHDPPFCDAQKYYDCRVEDGLSKIVADDCPPSCITVRNQYTLATTGNPCDDTGDGMCSFASLWIMSYDHSYVIFEDRFQLTTPQFVSQLGGDIGLYTGLSVLSIWQLIAFLHNRYKRYVQNTALGKRGFMIELFRDTATQFDRANGNDLEGTVRNDTGNVIGKSERETELEMRFETREKQFARVLEEVAILTDKQESLKRQVGDLKRRKNK